MPGFCKSGHNYHNVMYNILCLKFFLLNKILNYALLNSKWPYLRRVEMSSCYYSD